LSLSAKRQYVISFSDERRPTSRRFQAFAPAGISHPPTVYRALNELMQKGMVHRLQSKSAFVACGHGACDGKFAFAICRRCDKVVEIPLSDEDQTALLGLAPEEIAPEQVTLEIAGLCEACRRSRTT
jgi:Fur family zinc uptake transcriptional regulator